MRLALLLMAGLALAQPPQFDVATVKPSAPQAEGHTSTRMSSDTDTGKLNYLYVTLKDVVGQAYKVQQYQITAPAWADTDRFDIVARFPPHSDAKNLPLMLQDLLADRFKLAIHRETKELPVYSMVVAKGGPKFKPVESGEPSAHISNESSSTHWHVAAMITMRKLAEFLTDEAGRPVIDNTGLMGSYDITLDWSPDDSAKLNDTRSGPSLFTAIQEQLGLKLESAKGPVETIVIDHAERTPTPD